MNALVLSLILLANPGPDPAEDAAGTPPAPSSVKAATSEDSSAPHASADPAEPAGATSAEAARRQAENEAVIRMAEEAERTDGTSSRTEGASDSEDSLPTLTGALIQMFFVLGAVCLLAYVLLGRVLPRLMRVQMPQASQRILRVVDRVAIDQRGAILIVSVGDNYFLIGVSQGGIDLISRLEADVVLAALEEPSVHAPKLSKWAEALLAKRQKES